MSRRATLPAMLVVVIVLVAVAAWPVKEDDGSLINALRDAAAVGDTVERAPVTFPNLAGVVIPPNLCPVNFLVREPAEQYYVRLASTRGEAIEVTSDTGVIVIAPARWRTLLEANRGDTLTVDVAVRGVDRQWRRFRPVEARIATDEIDRYLVYRTLGKYNQIFKNIGIYQRDLETWKETELLQSMDINRGCMNCHTFLGRDPSVMVMHVRSKLGGGMLLVRDGKISRVDTRSRFNPTPAKYVAMHPNGKLVAFAESKLVQFVHTVGEGADVFDAKSDLALYLFDTNTVTTTPEICTDTREETYPSWGPDGRYLYFCSAPKLPPYRWKEVQYDLVRITYDVKTNTWGKLETVLSAKEIGLSMSHPRVSPDGRFLLFSASAYGSFPVLRADSDLYILDLETRKYRPLAAVNSDEAEAWHTWSSNGRWIVFSSRRHDGMLTKLYFTHFDENGNASKPLLLPQKDPTFYESFLKTYNLPEFATGPIGVGKAELIRALDASEQLNARLDPKVTPRVTEDALQRDLPQEPTPE